MLLRFIFILIVTILIISCNDSLEEIPKLEGYYSLVSISCECNPINLVQNQQQCSIDTSNNILFIKTFFDDEVKNLFLEEGEYPITIAGPNITVEVRKYGFSMENNTLRFDTGSPSGIADLPVYFFNKN